MSSKRFLWGSAVSLFILLVLTMFSLQTEVEAAQADTPTPSPTATARPQNVRRTVLANSIRGLALNAPNDAHSPPCQSADFGVSIWQNGVAFTSGSFVDVSPLFRERGVMMRVTDGFFPAICSSDPIDGAVAINEATGTTIPALVWSYNPSDVISSNLFYAGSVSQFFVAQLPLEAYRQGGGWKLQINTPFFTEVNISLSNPSAPTALVDGSGNYVMLGFRPGEHVVGLIFSNTSDENGNPFTAVLDDFEFIANQGGNGSVSSQRYWNAVTTFSEIVSGLMVLVGDQGSGIYYPLGENGTFIFPNDNSIHPADANGDNQVSADELIRYVRQNYWVSNSSSAPSSNGSGSCGVLSPRMVIGRQGRVTPGQPNNLRNGARLSASKIGTIPGNGPFLVLAGPTCADGYTWWQVNYNGAIGWTAEGGNGAYWLIPS